MVKFNSGHIPFTVTESWVQAQTSLVPRISHFQVLCEPKLVQSEHHQHKIKQLQYAQFNLTFIVNIQILQMMEKRNNYINHKSLHHYPNFTAYAARPHIT